ncbi:MAG: hypothetical protein ABI823_15330 [Bryobacteraceae bacterium]
MRLRTLATPFLAILMLSGCGYIGEPLPPALNIPVAITDLRALEYGDHLLVEFTAPALSTEGLGLTALRGVELRVGPTEPNFNLDRWAPGARRIDAEVLKPGAVSKEIPIREFVGKELVVAARAIGPKGRTGAWSNLAVVAIVNPLEKPRDLKAVASADGVQLSWAGSHTKFRIYRGTRDEEPAPIAESAAAAYADTSAQFETPYRYFVQAIQEKAESEVSDSVRLTPEDKFPPAVPAGLAAITGPDSIELTWERNTEPDFRAYRIYRAPEGGVFTQIAASVDTPNYSDKTVEPKKKYRYTVTSFDLKGNESRPSAEVEVLAPEKP